MRTLLPYIWDDRDHERKPLQGRDHGHDAPL
jgi:hypothetical protein